MIQPGQASGSLGLALGYGRKTNLKEDMQVGVNAYKLYSKANNVQFGVTIEKTSGAVHEFACTQVQKTIAGRHDILKETTLKDYKNIDPKIIKMAGMCQQWFLMITKKLKQSQ